MELRKQQEAEFHDRLRTGVFEQRWSPEAEGRTSNDPLWSNLKYYSVERNSIAYMRDWVRNSCKNKVVLDYGCGNGEESFFAAEHGAAKAVGIDISEAAIQNCRHQAAARGFGAVTEFHLADGEALHFESDSVDLAMEYGVLHHVDLNRAMAELARVLTPEGKMICTETLGHNPGIRLYRTLTPHLRTQWEVEHILRKKDFETIAQYFRAIELRFFHLTTIAAVPLRRFSCFNGVLSMLESLDEYLLKIPFLKWHAWQAVFVLSKPNKPTRSEA